MNIPDKAVEAAARAIYGEARFKVHGWSVTDRLTCESQAQRALQAAAPYIAGAGRMDLSDVAELNGLPVESVVRTPQGYTLEKLSDGWYRGGVGMAYQPNKMWLPAALLYTPDRETQETA